MAEYITARTNSTIKLCRQLQSGAKERREAGLFLVEGARLCREVFTSGVEVQTVLITAQAMEKGLLPPMAQRSPELLMIADDLANVISDTKAPQGIFCICKLPSQSALSLDPQGKYLILDSLQDPGNLGTIVRGAEAFGITALVLSGDCPDCYSPKVLRSTMGSLFRQPIYRTEDLSGTIGEMRRVGIRTYAAILDDCSAAIQTLGQQNSGGLAVVVGNEGNGISPSVIAACDASVYIPMTKQIESLNVAAAATVIMWEMAGRNR